MTAALVSSAWNDRRGEAIYRGWVRLVPDDVAVQQAIWEREVAAWRARSHGFILREVGSYLMVSKDRARQIIIKAEKHRAASIESYGRWMSPVELWGNDPADVRRLAA